jgi:hypothetical protein
MGPSVGEFLRLLWGEQEGVAELYTIPPEGPHIAHAFTYPVSLNSFVDACTRHSGRANVHMGVCLRKPGTKIGWDAEKKESRRGAVRDVLSACAVWVDIDFKKTPRENALPLVKNFPIQPSMAVLSGGGVHLYWLLKEPATGGELARIKPINKALVAALSADPECVDLPRVFRVPGTLNMKYAPPAMCRISEPGWHPERRYTLSDFDFLSPGEPEKPPPPSQEFDPPEAKAPVFADLPPQRIERVVKLLKTLWTNGWRHEMALDVAGAMAHAGVAQGATERIVKAVSDAMNGDTDARLRDVADTYSRFAEGKEVKGFVKLEERIIGEFDGEKLVEAKSALDSIRKLLPKRKKETAANFEIVKHVRYKSIPARDTFTLRRVDGHEFTVSTDSENVLKYVRFRDIVWGQAKVVLYAIGQDQWDRMLEKAPAEEREAPREATPFGAFEIALEEFMKDKKQNPDTGDLKSFPGYDEEKVFLRRDTLSSVIKDHGLNLGSHVVAQYLGDLGWKTDVRRFGKDTVRVWTKPIQNGHQPSLFKDVENPPTTRAREGKPV